MGGNHRTEDAVLVLTGGAADATTPAGPWLCVTTDGRAGAVAAAPADRDAARFGHLEVGAGGTRGAAATLSGPADVSGDAGTLAVPPRWYSRVEDATDLATVARHADAHLDRLAAGDDGVHLAFDSLDPYVGSAPAPRLFRFVHLLTARARATGGDALFYLDPSLDPHLTRTLAPLFDRVVRPDVDAEVNADVDVDVDTGGGATSDGTDGAGASDRAAPGSREGAE
jgi:hypothetical protein